MLPVSQDFRDEVDAFHGFLLTLDARDWQRSTRFMEWTPWDVVAHLHYFDDVSLGATAGDVAFAARRRAIAEAAGSGKTSTQIQREALGHLDAEALLAAWRETAHALADRLGACAPKARLPWFGPDMGVTMFTTARYMETWAHAQAVYDLKGASRTHDDRIRNIVEIGVRTFGWTFVNRKLDPPGPPPHVRLRAPSGALWEYHAPDAGDEAEPDRIEGDAVDFCATVTQIRNVKDTRLKVSGEVARAWMEIAQCFAGAPVDPPPPGVRGAH